MMHSPTTDCAKIIVIGMDTHQ